MILLEHHGPAEIIVGFIYAEKIRMPVYPADFDKLLDGLITRRQVELRLEEDAWRMSVRDMLRHGKFKPTGRGKPASEYLLAAARKGFFPRINAVVDICNFISLSYLLPISIWDVDLAGVNRYSVRLGKTTETYVFNQGGQRIDLEGLVVGCAHHESDRPGMDGIPIINPVKDCQATKTHDDSTQIGAIIYAPATSDPAREHILHVAIQEFETLLSQCGDDAIVGSGTLQPESILSL